MPKIYDYINSKILPEGLPGQFLVTDETGQKVWLTLNANFSVLEKIGYDEVTSKPLWEGSAWPGSVVGETGDLQNLFSNIAISGQQTLIATSPTDILNVVAGSGISLTTSQTLKTLTISTTGQFNPINHGTRHVSNGLDPIPYTTDTVGGLFAPHYKQILDQIPNPQDLVYYRTFQLGVIPDQAGTSNNATITATAADTLKLLAGKGLAINGDHSTKEITFTLLGGAVAPALHKLTHMVGGSDAILLNEFGGSISDEGHGEKTLGTLHALVTDTTHGFMSNVDKIKLDASSSENTPNALVVRDAFGNFAANNLDVNRITLQETVTANTIDPSTDFDNILKRVTNKEYVDKVKVDSFYTAKNYPKTLAYKKPVLVATTAHLNASRQVNTYVQASKDFTHFKLTAKQSGTAGNDISLTILDPAIANESSRSFSMSVSDNAITIIIARTWTGSGHSLSTTGNDVVTAINQHAFASLLVTASDGKSTFPTARAQTYLEGGDSFTDPNILTANQNGTLTVDGVTITLENRILVKDQNTGFKDMNGIYEVIDQGSGTRPWKIKRTSDFSSPSDELVPEQRVHAGSIVFVQRGTLNGGSGFILDTQEPITINSTELAFSSFTGATALQIGNGLYRAGRVLHAGGSEGRIVVLPGRIDLAEVHQNEQTYVKPVFDKYGRAIRSELLEESDLPTISTMKLTGMIPMHMLPTGTSSNNIALGNHDHGDLYLYKSGGTLTGPLTLPSDPTQPLHPATKQWVESKIETSVLAGNGLIKSGGNTLHIQGASGRIVVNEDNIDLAQMHTGNPPLPTAAYMVSVDIYGRVTGWNAANAKLPVSAIPNLSTSILTSGIFGTDRLPMYSETGGTGTTLAYGNHQHLIPNPDGAGYVDKFIQASGATLVRGSLRSKVTQHTFADEFITRQWALDQITLASNELLGGQLLTDRVNTLVSNSLQYDEFAENVDINANLLTSGTVHIDRLPMDPQNSGSYVAYANHEHTVDDVTYGLIEKYIKTNGTGMVYGAIRTIKTAFTLNDEFVSKSYVDTMISNVTGGEGTITYAGNGLYRDGNDLHIGGTSGRIQVLADAVDLHALHASDAAIVNSMWTKVSVDRWGRVINAQNLDVNDIPSLPVSKITSGIFDLARLPVDTGNTGSATLLALGNHTHNQYFLKTGGSVTGPILMPSVYTPTNDDELVSKKYVDNKVGTGGSSNIVAGAGLIRTGDVIDVVGAANRIIANDNNIDLATIYSVGDEAVTQPWCKVTIDRWGRVIGVTGLTDADIPEISGSKIQSGKVDIDFLPTDDVNGSSNLLSRSNHTHESDSILSVSWAKITDAPSFLLSSGGNITGSIFMPVDHVATLNNELITKKYVDNFIHPNVVLKTGSTMTGALFLHTHNPSAPNEAVTKQYVDNFIKGLDIKESVRAASVEDINAVYNSSLNSLQAVNNGIFNLDGVSLSISERVLIKDQNNKLENGIYIVIDQGTPSTKFVLERVSDFSQPNVTSGAFTFVEEGTINKHVGFVLTTPNPVIVGISELTFTPFSSTNDVVAGNGLFNDGVVLHVQGTENKIDVSASGVTISSNYIGQTSITTVGTIAQGTWQGTQIANNYIASILSGKTYNGLTIDTNNEDHRFSLQSGSNIIHFEGPYQSRILLTNTSYVKLPETPDLNYVTLATDQLAVAPLGEDPGRKGLITPEDKAKLDAMQSGVAASIGTIQVTGTEGQASVEASTFGDTVTYHAGDGIEITTDAPSKTISIKQQNYGSLTVPFVAGTTIYQGSMVAIGTNGRLVLASSNNMNLMGRVVGFYNNELTVGDGDRADVVTIGIVDDPMAYWDPASPIYVGVDGQLTQTPPVSGFSQVVGYPLTTTAFYIQIQPAVQL